MLRQSLLPLALLAILLGPIALRPRADRTPRGGERTLVVITPHNEALRVEFARAFAAEHLARTGERVLVDWRTPGGTSEISRYVASEYVASFQQHWESTLGQKWSGAIERSFDNPKVAPAASPADDTPEQRARRAFLASEVTCGIDLFFGGGAFDFTQQAASGRLVDSGILAAHPELFGPAAIPREVGGEPYWDAGGRWVGTCLSAFGICYNADAVRRLGFTSPPRAWADLADPRFRHEVALANPTQSSSVNKAFEMLIQQAMLAAVAEKRAPSADAASPAEQEQAGIREGWRRAMRLLMRIGANARYFTDSSSKISLDVGAGDAAAGMTIDFYGRFESEAVRRPDGTSRLEYVNAAGGTSFGADPIGLFRGAPDAALAREFIAWTLSPAGQRLWNWQVSAPGGPARYALRRLPILPALYAPEFRPYRSDPTVNPYALAGDFTYHDRWTGPLFRPIAFLVRVMCIDPHDELTAAWRALIDAGFPPEATAAFSDVSAIDYANASGPIREALGSKIREVQLAKELADRFRAQYRRAAELARAGR